MKKIFTITMTPINPPFDDAAKNIVVGVACRLKEIQFYFIAAFGRQFLKKENITYLHSPFQRVGRHSMGFLQKVYVFFLTLLFMRKTDIFQFFFTPQPYFSRVYKKMLSRKGKKSIQIVSSIHTLFEKNNVKDIPALFFSDFVVVHSDYAKEQLIKLGVGNVRRIYPGIEAERFTHCKEESTNGQLDGMKRSNRHVVYAGTYKILNDAYSFDDFMSISKGVTDIRSDVVFVMACRIRTNEDRALESEFRKRAKERGLLDKFIFLETVVNMPLLFKRVSVGILPLKLPASGVMEIPLVILELSAAARCMVYSRVSPLEELGEKGIGICLEDPGPQAFIGALLKVLDDPAYGEKVATASQKAAEGFFSMDAAAEEYKKLYQALGESGR